MKNQENARRTGLKKELRGIRKNKYKSLAKTVSGPGISIIAGGLTAILSINLLSPEIGDFSRYFYSYCFGGTVGAVSMTAQLCLGLYSPGDIGDHIEAVRFFSRAQKRYKKDLKDLD